jgi:hypothetical protein
MPETKTITKLHCLRCRGSWWPKIDYPPKECPRCKSRLWQTPPKLGQDHEKKKKKKEKIRAESEEGHTGIPTI